MTGPIYLTKLCLTAAAGCLLVAAAAARAQDTSTPYQNDCSLPDSAVPTLSASGNPPPPNKPSLNNILAVTQTQIGELRTASFPELSGVHLEVHTFHSKSDYYRTSFSIPRFFFSTRMKYLLEVNPEVVNRLAPPDGVCAILAHELVHVVALSRGNRIRRFALVRLLSASYTAKFERRTDMDAIRRGYGDGLKSYRVWIYGHIPPNKLAQKQRNYFSPQEIANIQLRFSQDPQMYDYWSKHVPLTPQDTLEKTK